MTDEEFLQFVEKTARPALERHVLFKSNFRLSREDIEDVVQEALLRLIPHRNKLTATPTAWLNTVADNILKDRWRQSSKAVLMPLDESTPAPENDDDVLLKQTFRQAFFQLQPGEQQVLAALSVGKTQLEIALDLDIPATTVAHWIRTAKEKLRHDPKLLAIFGKDRS